MKKVLLTLTVLGLIGSLLLFSLLNGAANPILNQYLDQISSQIYQETQRTVKIESVDVNDSQFTNTEDFSVQHYASPF